jgi:hypothetical protein
MIEQRWKRQMLCTNVQKTKRAKNLGSHKNLRLSTMWLTDCENASHFSFGSLMVKIPAFHTKI